MNLVVLGLTLELSGVFIIALTEMASPFYGKIHGQPFRKTYWWNGWRPFYKNTKTLKWEMRMNRKPIVYGAIPPKYKSEIIGLLLILVGFGLQYTFYLN